jgi:hypothetical protein
MRCSPATPSLPHLPSTFGGPENNPQSPAPTETERAYGQARSSDGGISMPGGGMESLIAGWSPALQDGETVAGPFESRKMWRPSSSCPKAERDV